MNEERTWEFLRHLVEHRYYTDDFILTNRNPWFRSFLAETLYQGNPNKNHKLWNIGSTERHNIYTPYAGAVGMLLHINGMFTTGKLKSSLLS